MTTIHQLRASLDAAETNYRYADIEHPTAVHLAKEALTRARYEYWNACADLVTRIPEAIQEQLYAVDVAIQLESIYTEITGEQL